MYVYFKFHLDSGSYFETSYSQSNVLSIKSPDLSVFLSKIVFFYAGNVSFLTLKHHLTSKQASSLFYLTSR